MKLRKISDKKAALELAVGTIVIIVIAVTMLILGIVLVRNIMCGAMGLTIDINDKVKGEINKLFESSGGEVVCIGSGSQAVGMLIGETNIVMCGIKATEETDYKISLVDITSTNKKVDPEKWISPPGSETWTGTSNTADPQPVKKVLRLKIPVDAPETDLVISLKIEKNNGDVLGTQDLDFSVRKSGWFKSSLC